MNPNTNTNIQETKTCVKCMTFYANPKLGNFCSKCFSEIESDKIEMFPPQIDPSQNQTKIEIEKILPVEIEKPESIEKLAKELFKEEPSKPVQVTRHSYLLILYGLVTNINLINVMDC